MSDPGIHRLDAATMEAAPGVGLAAPQVGVPIQLAVPQEPRSAAPGWADAGRAGTMPFGLKAFSRTGWVSRPAQVSSG